MKQGVIRNRYLWGIAVLCLVGAHTSYARRRDPYGKEIAVPSAKKFHRLLDRYPHAVALFYYADKELYKDEEWGPKIKQLERMFEGLSREHLYEQSGLAFLRVNAAVRDLESVADRYRIFEGDVPAVILFRNGVAMRDDHENLLKLTGYVTYKQLDAFIKKHLKKRLKQETLRREDEAEERQERRENTWAVYPHWGYPYGGWYGPGYWYHPYYW